MNDAVNITKVTEVDRDKLISEYNKKLKEEMKETYSKIKNKEDADLVTSVSEKMAGLYCQMYFVSNQEEQDSLQRELDSYKSVLAAASAKNTLDIANDIIRACKKAAVFALSVAVKFVAL